MKTDNSFCPDHRLIWDSVPEQWKVIFKKNLIFQSEMITEQISQSKFAARYYDMETYWKVFFLDRKIDLTLTPEDYSKLLLLKKLKCGGTKIDDLELLQRLGLQNLEYLDCNHTEIDNIEALYNFNALKTLEIEYTNVADLTPLRACRSMTQLYISSTRISEINTLSQLPNLINLDLNDTVIDDLSSLAGLHHLETLVMNDSTHIHDISPLSSLKKLVKLDISRTRVNSIESLRGHNNLQILVAGDLDINSIDAVSEMPMLESLYINNSRSVIDLACLKEVKNLKALYIGGTEVINPEVILDIKSLVILFHSNLPQDLCNKLTVVNPACTITKH
jgi:Leucine-rich repeat (LRR) protein